MSACKECAEEYYHNLDLTGRGAGFAMSSPSVLVMTSRYEIRSASAAADRRKDRPPHQSAKPATASPAMIASASPVMPPLPPAPKVRMSEKTMTTAMQSKAAPADNTANTISRMPKTDFIATPRLAMPRS